MEETYFFQDGRNRIFPWKKPPLGRNCQPWFEHINPQKSPLRLLRFFFFFFFFLGGGGGRSNWSKCQFRAHNWIFSALEYNSHDIVESILWSPLKNRTPAFFTIANFGYMALAWYLLYNWFKVLIQGVPAQVSHPHRLSWGNRNAEVWIHWVLWTFYMYTVETYFINLYLLFHTWEHLQRSLASRYLNIFTATSRAKLISKKGISVISSWNK